MDISILRRVLGALLLLPASLTPMAVSFAQADSTLGVGDRAPDFVFQGSDGKQYSRDEMVAPGGVVIAWFPRAFTPG